MKSECHDHGACPSIPLPESKIGLELAKLDAGWQLIQGSPNDTFTRNKISREFKFNSYLAGVDFVSKVAKIAEEMNHHPDIYLGFKKVRIDYWTHNAQGVSEIDFQAAAKIDKL